MRLNWLLIADRLLDSGESSRKPKPEPTRHGETSHDGHRGCHPNLPNCFHLLRSPCPSTLQANQGFEHHSDHVIDILEIPVVMGGFRSAEGQ